MRVEIIGGMGIGKTTLCSALQNQGVRCIYEKLENNPYLELSYKDPEGFGFYSQMTFVMGNFFRIIRNLQQDDVTVFDYSTITDKAYATLFLSGKGRDLALQTIEFLEEKEGHADLYLNLVCSPEAQLRRIRARNRDHEAAVNIDFVRALSDNMQHYVREAEAKGLNVMTIDTENLDFRKQSSLAASLARQLRQTGPEAAMEAVSWPARQMMAKTPA
jgi:deoxyadenosine/deoxycytidine kinase